MYISEISFKPQKTLSHRIITVFRRMLESRLTFCV